MQYLEEGTHNILLAVDFSQPTKRSFDAAVRMARVFGATLHILHVNEEESMFRGHDTEEVNSFLDEVLKRRSNWMESFESAAGDLGIDVTTMFRDGAPAETILAVADEINAGMIVMGTQGARGIGSMLHGSVAKKVSRHAERPVLIISRMAGVAPAENGGSFDHVLYPTDFTEASQCGLKLAELFSRRTGGMLTLLNVLRMPQLVPSMPGEKPIAIPRSVADHLRTELEAEMETLVAGLDTEHVDSYIAINASPAEGITDAAKQRDVDLIMMPRHSSHGVRTVLFGRTAENLAKIAPVPILLFSPSSSPR